MFLYVIKTVSGSKVKIGVSRNVEQRLVSIQAHCPIPLELAFAQDVKRAPRFERALHKLFREQRIHGEWFKIDASVAVAEARRICSHEPRPEHPNVWHSHNRNYGPSQLIT